MSKMSSFINQVYNREQQSNLNVFKAIKIWQRFKKIYTKKKEILTDVKAQIMHFFVILAFSSQMFSFYFIFHNGIRHNVV